MRENMIMSDEIVAPRTTRNNKIPILSFICILLVIFIHDYGITDASAGTFAAKIEYFISKDIALVAVPMFFAMSAFLFFKAFSVDKIWSKYKSRFKSLVVPYLIWNTIYMFAMYVLSNLGVVALPVFPLNIKNIFNGVFLHGYNYYFWFLAQLIIFVFLSPLIYFLLKNKFVGICVILANFTICVLQLSVPVVRMDSLLFYLIGAYLGVHFKKLFDLKLKIGWVLFVTLFLAAQVVFFVFVHPSVGYGTSEIFKLLMVSALFVLPDLFNSNVTVPHCLDNSFAIYAMHGLVLESFNKIFSYILPQDSELILIDYFLSPVLTIALIILFVLFLKKIAPTLSSVIFGGR